MAAPSNLELAMRTRSLRAIQTELEFLDSVGLITPAQMDTILRPLKAIADTHASEAHRQLPQPEPVYQAPVQAQHPPGPYAVQARHPPGPYAPVNTPPAYQMSHMSVNEKAAQHNQYATSPTPPAPPAYPQVIGMARALWDYKPREEEDDGLSFQENQQIQIIKKERKEWWYGRNMTTGMEGLFPSNYVEEVPSQSPPVPSYGQPPSAKNYGNMPLDVSQSGQPANPAEPKQNKFEEGGKKFGKKLGNAAIFGAGATVGSNIVNSIF